MKCRVFKLNVGWGFGLFHFPIEIEGIMVKNEPRTKHLTKKDFIGVYDFDIKYLNTMESDILFNDLSGQVRYYFVYYDKK